jgi:hypothetical protein
VTVGVKPPIVMRSLLDIAQPAHRSDGQTLTWDWEANWGKSGVNVGLAFMSPGWFAEFETAQTAAASEDAGASQHIVLSQHYRRLASLPALLFDERSDFQSRYYPAAIAELQAALDSKGSSSEKAQAHSMLAELYMQQADQAEQGERVHYLQAAAAEVELALSGSAQQSDVLELAAKVFQELSDNANAAGDDATAKGYLRRLEGMRASSPQRPPQTQSMNDSLSQATLALDQGKTEVARNLIESLVEPQTATVPGAAAPLVSQTSLTVTTTPRGRQIVVHLGNGENPEKASELAARTVEALRKKEEGQAVATANTITLTLPGRPGPAMFALQRDLAAALPDAAELALLRSVLEGTRGSENLQTSQLRSTWRYTETVDLAPALLRWSEIAAGLEYTQDDPTEEAPDLQSEELQRVQRVLRGSDAAAWRRFAANSRVDYRFEPNTSDTNQEWQVGAGESRTMWIQESRWNLDRIHWTGIGLCAVVVGLAALVWRLA